MIDINKEIEMHIGDRVKISHSHLKEGSIEAIRVISDGKMVEQYCGKPDRVVVTIQLGDAVVNKRGFEITTCAH